MRRMNFTAQPYQYFLSGPTPDQVSNRPHLSRSEVSPAGRISPPMIAGRTVLNQDTAKPEPQIQSYSPHISTLLPTIVSCPAKFVSHAKRSWPWHNLLPEFPSTAAAAGNAVKTEPNNQQQDPSNQGPFDNLRQNGTGGDKRNGNYFSPSKQGGNGTESGVETSNGSFGNGTHYGQGNATQSAPRISTETSVESIKESINAKKEHIR